MQPHIFNQCAPGRVKQGVPFSQIIYNFSQIIYKVMYNCTLTHIQFLISYVQFYVQSHILVFAVIYNIYILYIILRVSKYTLFSVYIQKICKIPSDFCIYTRKKCIFNCTYGLLNILRTIIHTKKNHIIYKKIYKTHNKTYKKY